MANTGLILPDHPIYERGLLTADGCLLWPGAVKSNGYGHLWHEGKTVSIHRLSWEISRGRPVPPGLRVLHSCDVRHCFHPDHLHTGTAGDNSREMVSRLRYQGPAKLSPAARAQARQAVHAGESQRAVAARFGVSQATICNIMSGKHTALGDARWAMRLFDAITGVS